MVDKLTIWYEPRYEKVSWLIHFADTLVFSLTRESLTKKNTDPKKLTLIRELNIINIKRDTATSGWPL